MASRTSIRFRTKLFREFAFHSPEVDTRNNTTQSETIIRRTNTSVVAKAKLMRDVLATPVDASFAIVHLFMPSVGEKKLDRT